MRGAGANRVKIRGNGIDEIHKRCFFFVRQLGITDGLCQGGLVSGGNRIHGSGGSALGNAFGNTLGKGIHHGLCGGIGGLQHSGIGNGLHGRRSDIARLVGFVCQSRGQSALHTGKSGL